MNTARLTAPEAGSTWEAILGLLPVAVYACDAAGRITYYNERAAALWGRRPELGAPDSRFCGSWRLRRRDGSVLPHDQTPMAVALKRGVAARDEEVVIEREDGSSVVVSVNVDPLVDADGAIVGAVNAFQDISRRVRAAEAVRESDQRYRDLLHGLGVAVYTTDARGFITLFNEEAAALWGRHPRIGEDRWCGSQALYWPDGRPMALEECPMALTLREKRPIRDMQIVAERPDGGRVTLLTVPTPLHDSSGNVVGAVNVLIDVTEQSRAEAERSRILEAEQSAREQAEAAVRARDEFLSIAAHELRNPVAGVKGSADLLRRLSRRGKLTEERTQEHVEVIAETSSRLARLVDDLLDVSRLESGRIQLRIEPTDLSEVVRTHVQDRKDRAYRQRVRLELAEPAVAAVDRERFEQIVANLLENALKYSDDEVLVMVESRADEMIVRVSDHGIGVPSGALESIFQPFGRAPNADSTNLPGMGLGLYVCRRLARAHGGRLWAESPGEGKGSTFVLALPASGA